MLNLILLKEKESMINSISGKSPSTPSYYSSVADSQQKPEILNKIKGLLDLPPELIYKIAAHLSTHDYASLRETCTALSQDLYSFATLEKKLDNPRCYGTFKAKSMVLIEGHLKSIISKDKHITEAISSLSKRLPHIFNQFILEESSKFSFSMESHIDWSQKVKLNNIFHIVQYNVGNAFFSYAPFFEYWNNNEKTNTIDLYVEEMLDLRILIKLLDNPDVSLSDAKQAYPGEKMFSALQAAFDSTTGAERYIIATLAAKTIEQWVYIAPNGIDETMVKKLEIQYEKLISIGIKVGRYAVEKMQAEAKRLKNE